MSLPNATIRARVQTLLAAGLTSGTGIAEPNKRFTPTVGTNWVAYFLQTFRNQLTSMGEDFTDHEGQVVVQCFVPQDAGADDAETLAVEVETALLGETFTDGKFYDVELKEVGPDGEGWYQYNVEIRWMTYEDRR